jgi:2'-5' RNA ligase
MRLFIGVDLPNELKLTLLKFQAELRQLGVEGHWKSRDNFHITLEFLGELDPDVVTSLSDTLSKVGRKFKPFELMIGGVGAFPSLKHPSVLWTAVRGNLTELHRLRDILHQELKIRGLKLDERQFKPHITLASRTKLEKVDLSGLQAKRLDVFKVSEVVLFESSAIRGKRVYSDLFTANFETNGG